MSKLRQQMMMIILSLFLGWTFAYSVPSLITEIRPNVYVIHDDVGAWGGMDLGMGITHQLSPNYQAKKILDVSHLPREIWEKAQSFRLSLYFMVRDYSWHDLPQANGLDEAYQIVINGHIHEYPTNGGAPVFLENKPPQIAWHDIAVSKEELIYGLNEIIVRKAPGKPGQPEAKPDDYLYLGIDNTQKRGNSSVTFDGVTWTQDKLTVPGGNGEYMIRLYVIGGRTTIEALWQPGKKPALHDPAHVILYAGGRGLKPTEAGLSMPRGRTARLEWAPEAFDALQPLQIAVQAQGPVKLAWLDEEGRIVKEPAIAGLNAELPAARAVKPSGLLIAAQEAPAVLQSVQINGGMGYHPFPEKINMAPIIQTPREWPAPARPQCSQQSRRIIVSGGYTQAIFEQGQTLRLVSLKNPTTEMLRHPEEVALFMIEVGQRRLYGSQDFVLRGLQREADGFVCTLENKEAGLQAVFTVQGTNEGIRLSLNIINIGVHPVDFKVAFPHLAGLALSPNPAEDYYFYPLGGGIIAPTPALIRKGYGDHEALYQIMDLFSPTLGCGVYLRADDTEGWHKLLVLHKHLPGRPTIQEKVTAVDNLVKEEYRWTNSLDKAVEGTSFAYEYLRRTRAPQAQAAAPAPEDAATLQKTASFAPAAAVIAAHPGDWHEAMQRYAAWAHRVWKFRPYPSRLKSVRNMIAAGWGQGILFRDGKYRTDFITPQTDCIELMSWWEWSPLGPFKTPLDQLEKIMSPGEIKLWEPYFVKDPVTGQLMWNNQPGDYKGYNERFGGLPAFQQAVKTYQAMGALVTLYTDPFRLDDNCEIGAKYGEKWSTVLRDGKKSTAYYVWNPCHQLAEVRQWVAETMGRVMRETGADGIRLDEYGHRGWACHDETHQHTYQEPGITQWQKAVAETTKLVHAAMDKVRPDLVLTTEHPGYDYLMQYLEGCITYDLTVLSSRLRPVECNIQRFFFPECKAYELDHRGVDPLSRKKFWNAVESFGRYYPTMMYNILSENEDVYQGRDCTPLCPTLQPFIYANRFAGAGKLIIHLYNGLGHTYEGPLLSLAQYGISGHNIHAMELLQGEELPLKEGKISLYIERDDIACVALMSPILHVDGQGRVHIADGRGGELVVVDEKGENIYRAQIKGNAGHLPLEKLVREAKPLYIKLLRQGQLVDAVPWPV